MSRKKETMHSAWHKYESGKMSYEEYVGICFDEYEAIGFKDVFDYPGTDYKDLQGLRFKVIGRVPSLEDDPNGTEPENLPMWDIVFENGERMAAYPEEICLSDR